jgi:hypothetical protein
LPVHCYLCGADHKGYGLARIGKPQTTPLDVPLCKDCRTSDDVGNAVARKSLGVS